jgi:hypothetical protein
MRETVEAAVVLDYEPALVEEAVLIAIRGHREERAFRRERDRLYEERDAEAREAAFRKHHVAWFERLALGRPVCLAFTEWPAIGATTRGNRVALARSRHEEGAELFVGSPADTPAGTAARWVVIRLRPEMLAAPDRTLGILRHELLHIADMLDPRFRYEPRLPSSPAGPAHENLLRERYRVLWDAFVDGRLVRLGLAPALLRDNRLAEFARTFPMLGPMLGPRMEETFARFFDGEACTHPDLVALAINPDGAASLSPSGARPADAGPRPGERCPLCRFPTHAFEPTPEALPGDVVASIQTDFPAWSPTHGLCRQCADLYRSRLPVAH